YGDEAEDAHGGRGRSPVSDTVEQVVTGRGDGSGVRRALVVARECTLALGRALSPGFLGKEREELVGEAQVQGVLDVRARGGTGESSRRAGRGVRSRAVPVAASERKRRKAASNSCSSARRCEPNAPMRPSTLLMAR